MGVDTKLFVATKEENILKIMPKVIDSINEWQRNLAINYSKEKGFRNPKELHDAIKRKLENMQQDFFDKMERGEITEQEMEIYEQAEKNGIVGDK